MTFFDKLKGVLSRELLFRLSIKFVFAMLMLSRGSAYEIAFAAQMHENRGRVPRFSYFQREKVSARELSDVRVLRSQNTDCRKNEVFRQSQIPTHQESVFQLVEKVRFGLMPRRAFAFPKEKIAAPKENPLKELLCVSSPERDFFSSISR